jgi:dimethylamine monooxygenase subunit A
MTFDDPGDLWEYLPDSLAYEDAGVPAWLDELDLTPPPPHVKMGTRAISPDQCFVADQFRESELYLRQRLLNERHRVVFASRPSADAAAEETLELVSNWLRRTQLAEPSTLPAMHPLERAGRSVQEDLCLMVYRDGDWHLDAAVLCFPSLWSLQEKFAQSTGGLHGGVAHYVEELSVKVDRFFDRLRPGQAVWRRNLSIKPYPLLFLPVPKEHQPVITTPVNENGSPFWLRTERQTLQLLPKSKAILFTIKLQLAPARVLLDRLDRAADLLLLYQSLDESMAGYKTGANTLEAGFLGWLQEITTNT